MLTLAEEALLLILDDQTGQFIDLPIMAREHALVGGLLMDLAFKNRIDTDLKQLILVSGEPTGDAVLDEVLAEIQKSEKPHDATYWVELLARRAEHFQDQLLDRLVAHGIIKREDHKILWVFSSRRYPVIDQREEREVKARISEVIFSDIIPEPRDIAIICLAHSCALLTEIFSWREIEAESERIEQVCKMDLIGRAVFQAINELRMNSIAATMQGPPLTI